MSRIIFCALLCVWTGVPSLAQPSTEPGLDSLLGTIGVTANPAYADGKLTGCHLEFTALVRDWTYRNGAFLRVGGSIGILTTNNKPGVTLKVIVHERDPSSGQFAPMPPASAYFVSGAKTTKSTLAGSYPSDTPGGLFSVFQLDPAGEMIMSGVTDGKITFAFARKLGGMDILVPIETDVADIRSDGTRVRSPKIVDAFLGCVLPLLEQSK